MVRAEIEAGKPGLTATSRFFLTAVCMSFITNAISYSFAASRAPRAARELVLPLRFERSGVAEFHNHGGTIVLKTGAVTIRAASGSIHMKFPGSAPSAPRADDPHPVNVNYLLGANQANWRTNISSPSRVSYDDLYPGTDLIFYGHAGQIEYDFRIAPRADPSESGWHSREPTESP